MKMPQLLELSHHVTISAFHYENIIFNPLDLWGTKLARYVPSHPSLSKAERQIEKNRNMEKVLTRGDGFEQNCRYFKQFGGLILEALDAVRQARLHPSPGYSLCVVHYT